MIYEVTHTTTYSYASEVSIAYNQARLAPRRLRAQHLVDYAIDVLPYPDDLHDHLDFYGNRIDQFSIHVPHRELSVTARSRVDVLPPSADGLRQGDPPSGAAAWDDVVARLRSSTDADDLHARQFVLPSPLVEPTAAAQRFAAASFVSGRPVGEALLDLNHRISSELAYVPGVTSTSTPIDEVLAHRAGVCQDFAHLLIACARGAGLPARYVSGYLETDPPPGTPKLVGADASHAWASVYVCGAGWIDLDPTNDTRPDGRHITTAWGRDYSDVTPLNGVVFSGGGGHTLAVSVDVSRVV